MTSRGFALMTVLWLTLLMGIMVAALAQTSGQAARGAQLGHTRIAAEVRAETGLHRAIWVLKTGETPELKADGLVWTQRAGDEAIAIRITAAEGLVDLNTAAPAVLSDVQRAISTRLDLDAAEGATIQTRLAALQGRALSPLDITEVIAEFRPDRATSYALAGLVTVGSGLDAPLLPLAPEAILRDVVGLSGPEVEATLTARKEGRVRQADWPEAYAAPDYPGEARPRGTFWHISVASGVPGGSVQVGQTWVVFLPLPETRPQVPFYILAHWNLPVDDPIFVALDDSQNL